MRYDYDWATTGLWTVGSSRHRIPQPGAELVARRVEDTLSHYRFDMAFVVAGVAAVAAAQWLGSSLQAGDEEEGDRAALRHTVSAGAGNVAAALIRQRSQATSRAASLS